MELRLRFSCLAASSIAAAARIGRSASLWSTRARARASSHCGCATSCERDQVWLVLAMGESKRRKTEPKVPPPPEAVQVQDCSLPRCSSSDKLLPRFADMLERGYLRWGLPS